MTLLVVALKQTCVVTIKVIVIMTMSALIILYVVNVKELANFQQEHIVAQLMTVGKILQLMHFMLVKDIVRMIGNALEPSYVEVALIARTHPKTMILKDAVNKVVHVF